MTCYKPVSAWHSVDPHIDSKKRYLVFTCPYPCRAHFTSIQVPCGQCLGCRLDHSRDWAIRCTHEASLNIHNIFITLTYDDENIPPHGSLRKSDFQKFMKRLRKQNDKKQIRYFMCGEYGDTTQRPHYHALLFNHHFTDAVPFKKTDADHIIYTSDTLDDLWTHGHCQIGSCTYQSAGYISRYVLKKRTGPLAAEHYQGRTPEYIDMSRRPGLAKPWFDKFHKELTISDQVIIDGHKKPMPKYYDKLISNLNPGLMEDLKIIRKENLLKHEENNTPERLAVREAILQRKADLLQRNLK